MKTVKEITRTCIACPEQYEGKLDSGEEFYVRCRWGCGYLKVDGEIVSEVEYEDAFRGIFKEGDLIKLFFENGIYLDTTLIQEDSGW